VAFRIWLLAVAALLAVSAAAAAQRPVPKHYYLALGDSVAYGMQPDKVKRGLPPSGFDTGYVDLFAARLRALNPKSEVVNYACPGEYTLTFTRGPCPWLAEGGKLHTAFRGTQMQAALAFLQAHPGQVSPITLTLWGNDVLDAFHDCNATISCIRSRTPSVVAAFESRLGSILRRLRSAAPSAEIVVTGAWNFDVDRLQQTNFLYRALNPAIRRSAAAANARFADVLPLFNPAGSIAAQKARLCAYTFICSADDVHPTNAGYRAIAVAVLEVSGYKRR
jgi:lysophospholipase L1-like esterase